MKRLTGRQWRQDTFRNTARSLTGRRVRIIAGACTLVVAGAVSVAVAYVTGGTARGTGTVAVNASASTKVPAGSRLRAPEGLWTQQVPTAPGDGSVRLTWSLTSPTRAVTPGGYLIERRDLSQQNWQRLTLSPTCDERGVCTVTDATAALNHTYRYKVASLVGAAWTSHASASVLSASIQPVSARLGDERYTFNDVATLGDQRIAVGPGGAIRVCVLACSQPAAVWVAVRSPVSADLLRVAIAGADDAWAVGDDGVVAHCTVHCLTQNPKWTFTTLAGAPDLRGVFAPRGSSYVAVVGDGGLWFSTDTIAWKAGLTVRGTTVTGIAGRTAKEMVVVGSRGTTAYVAGCSMAEDAVCGAVDTSFTAGIWPFSSGVPKAVVSAGETYVAVGTGGAVARAMGPAGSWNAVPSGTSADLITLTPEGSDGVVVAGSADASVTCFENQREPACSPSSSKPDHATLRQEFPPPVDPARLAAPEDSLDVLVPTLGGAAGQPAACGAASLRAAVTLPAADTAMTPVVTARVVVSFPNNPSSSTAAAWLLGSLDGGAYRSVLNLGTVRGDGPLRVVGQTMPGLALPDSGTSNLSLCLVGASDGGAMSVDMVHVDLTEN